MEYVVSQSFKCDYRIAKPQTDSKNITKCPTCGAVICSHNADLSEMVASQLARDCKFVEKIEMKKYEQDDNGDYDNYYNENYDENDNYIGDQDVFKSF